jgi:DNA-binding MarR family transcriptional regulator
LVTTLEEKGIYGLVGSPERLKILEELKSGPKDRGYFIKLLDLWPQAVKYHVDILVKGKLVAEKWSKTGRRKKIYTLTKEGEEAVSRVTPAKRFPSDDWVEVFLGPRGRDIISYLASLSDGEWHDLTDARRKVGDRELEVLQRNGMLQIDGRRGKLRVKEFNLTIDYEWLRRLAERGNRGSGNGDDVWST